MSPGGLAVPGAQTNGSVVPARPSELVRFATAGSVDDGKSTLIGRLLFDTKSIFEDQLAAVEAPVTILRVYWMWPGVSAMMNLRLGVAK